MTLEEAFNAYYNELLWFGNKLVANKQAAEDIIVDVFVAVKDTEIDGLRFYLYRAVKNRCLNYLAYIKTHRTEELDGINELQNDEWLEGSMMIRADYLKKMHEAIQHLTGTEKEVIDLYLKGKEAPEIASIINKRQDTVRSIKRVAINKLRKAIL